MKNLLNLIKYLSTFNTGDKLCLTLDAAITEDGFLLADVETSQGDAVLHIRVDLTDVDMVVMDHGLADATFMADDATNDPDYNIN